jgi:hypothetical protein
MKPDKLSDLKKALLVLNATELTEICLRLAKYKKENKELLAYLLFDANEPMNYAEDVKSFLIADFIAIQKHYFYSTKSLRKIIRLLNGFKFKKVGFYLVLGKVTNELALIKNIESRSFLCTRQARFNC